MGKKAAAKSAKAAQRAKSNQNDKHKSSYHSGDLTSELKQWDLRVAEVKADGNCFFRAAADQLEGANGDHMALRQKVVNFIRQHSDDFEPYMEDGETLERYCKRMSEDGTWAGYQEQVALARLCRVAIRVYQAGQPVWTIKPEHPDFPQDAPAIHLSYHDGEHYNSVRRADDQNSGPPLPIAVAERAPTSAEKAAARSWGAAEEDVVVRGTGCYDDPAAVRQALDDARGNADQAIEILIERLASAAVPSKVEQEFGEAKPSDGSDSGPPPVNVLPGSAEIQPPSGAVCCSERSEAEESAVFGNDSAQVSEAQSTGALTSMNPGESQHGTGFEDGHTNVSQSQCPSSISLDVQCIAADIGRLQCSAEGSADMAMGGSRIPCNGTCTAAGLQSSSGQESVPQSAKQRHGSKLAVAVGKKPARNRECPCGSKKRYKNCCGPADAAAARRLAQGIPEEPAAHGMPSISV